MSITYLDSSCQANIAENFRRTEAAIDEGGGGGGGGALVVTATYDSETSKYTLNKTAGEIYEACPLVVAVEEDEESGGFAVYQLGGYFFSNDEGYLFRFIGEDDLTFSAASADDYPTADMGGGGD